MYLKLIILCAVLASGTAVAYKVPSTDSKNALVDNPRAQQNWMLKCQGCHRADALTKPMNAPPLAGEISKVLSVPGGREYLARVPGVATVDLPSDEVAELLNWTIYRFDPEHIPSDFIPYTGDEIEFLRKSPLRVEAPAMRKRLYSELNEQQSKASN